MAPASNGMSIRAYAKHRRDLGLRGGTVSAVQRALSSGRIPRNKRGKIDAAAADAAWEENTDGTRGGGHDEPGGSAGQSPPSLPGVPDYKTARAAREIWAAKREKLEYERLAESMVNTSEVQLEAFQLAHSVRNAIQAVPSRVASIFAAETDAAKIEALLGEELRAALEMLSSAEA